MFAFEIVVNTVFYACHFLNLFPVGFCFTGFLVFFSDSEEMETRWSCSISPPGFI